MTLILVTPPSVEPVSLAEAKQWLRVETDAEDTLVSSLIVSARLVAEQTTRRLLLSQGWRILLDAWPSGDVFDLPLAPLLSVDAIRMRDAAGGVQTLDVASYMADLGPDRSRLAFVSPPPSPARAMNGVEIDVTAGYGADAGDVPQPIRQAMLMLIAHWFENRGDVFDHDRASLPAPVAALLSPWRRARLA